MLRRLYEGVYECDACGLLVVDPWMSKNEVVRDGVSYGVDPPAVLCDNGCDDE